VAVVSMSKQEFSRLDVLLRVQSGRLRINDACVLIGLQRRQVFRLLPRCNPPERTPAPWTAGGAEEGEGAGPGQDRRRMRR
jgi:hypothetical protein